MNQQELIKLVDVEVGELTTDLSDEALDRVVLEGFCCGGMSNGGFSGS
jgi:hypothetical protein